MLTRSAAEVTKGEHPGMETIEDKRKLACGTVFLDHGDAFMSICWSNVLNQHFKYGHYTVCQSNCVPIRKAVQQAVGDGREQGIL